MDVEQQGLEPLRHFDKRILPSLDGLRGIAVLLVLAYHNVSVRIPGPMGVEIFFVLSGFLLTKLLLKEVDDTGTISIRSFYWRRALRIFPAFYVYMLLVALVDHVTPAYYWSGMTYTINYYVARHGNRRDNVPPVVISGGRTVLSDLAVYIFHVASSDNTVDVGDWFLYSCIPGI